MEVLKNQLEAKDLLIRTLIIKYNDVYDNDKYINYCDSESSDDTLAKDTPDETLISSVNCLCSEIIDDEPDWDKYFNDLYMQFDEQCQPHVSSKETLNNQLLELRRQKHQTYMKEKHPEIKQKDLAKPKILIASDSMMNQMEGTRLSKMYDIKVACWGGCNIRQMRGKLGPISEKESYDYITNVGTNDSITRTSEEMLGQTIV